MLFLCRLKKVFTSLKSFGTNLSDTKLLFLSIYTVEPRRYPSITFPPKFLNPSTAIELEPGLISAPEHERLNEFDPASVIVTSSVPDEALLPDQEPDAEQEEARVDDQVKVALLLTSTETSDEAIVTVAVGNAGAADPPPPPPQETKIVAMQNAKKILFILKDMLLSKDMRSFDSILIVSLSNNNYLN